MSELKYENPVDVFKVFSGDLAIKEFVEFMFNENYEMCKVLESECENVIYPMIYEENISSLQIDYSYFVYLVGKFFASKSGNKFDLNKILGDFALTSSNISSMENKRNIKLLVDFFESYIGLFNCGNYKTTLSNI